jgi:O-methyltransferase involved in polyketide biosynthesis
MLSGEITMPPNELRTDVAHSARIYDYILGGKDNFAVDRAAAEKMLEHTPGLPISMRANRRFMTRAVRHLARAGIRQFLDIGTGLPTHPNLHEVVQEEAPDAAVLYVDNDPLVLVHARALLTGVAAGQVAYLDADLREPGVILADPTVTEVFDLTKPVALTLIAVLQHLTEPGQAQAVIDELMSRFVPGSALAISVVTADYDPNAGQTVSTYNSSGVPVVARTRDEVVALFGGVDLVEPGVVPVHQWHPSEEDRQIDDKDVYMYGGVGFKH